MFPDGLNFADLTWKDGATARLSLIETPLSFRIESNEGRVLGGQIEPGIFFLPERSYTVDMFDILNKPVGDGSPIPINIGDGQVYMQEAQNPTLEQGINLWYCLSKDWTPGSNSHPLLMQNSYASNAVKLNPSDIQYLNAHGTSTSVGDVNETNAIKLAFGEDAKKLVVNSTKSMTGHLLGGAGGIESVFTVLALKNQVSPPTINIFNQDPECDLDYCANVAREMPIRYAMKNSFGFGGTNGSLIFGQV